MTTNSLKVFCATISLTALGSFAQTIEEVSKSVVYLRHDDIETFTETYANQKRTLEVWLKLPETDVFRPKMSSKGGTGFLIGRASRYYLVTAKHVAVELGFNDKDFLITGLQDGLAGTIPLAALRRSNTGEWIHHTNADVSILPISFPQALTPFLRGHVLDAYSYLQPTTNRPPHEVILTVIGFPLGIGWGRELGEPFDPLILKTRAASGFIEAGTYFLLQDPSVQGYSGAPVFDLGDPVSLAGGTLQTGGRATGCYGIMSQTRGDNTGGKMAGVVPTKCILELLDEYESKH